MTANLDLERRIAQHYASEPSLRAPDRVLANALTTIESTPQRRVLVRAPWRFPDLNTFAMAAIAAAAIVAVAGFAVLNFSPDVGGLPTPIPTIAPSPTSGPSPTQGQAVALPADDRVLAPGRYSVEVPGTDVRVTFTVTTGDWRGNGWYLSSPNGAISFWAVANVYPDACEESLDRLPDPPIGPTVEDLAQALDAQEGTDLQSIANPAVGGYPSAHVVVEPSGSVGQRCPNGQNMQLWVGPGNTEGRAIDIQESRGDRQDVMWIVDAGGHRVVIVAYHDPTSPEAVAVDRIISSIEFVLP
jgi:hypothetical protein